jgi:hypothetical protein
MTESHRTKLMTACAFARVFMDSADREIRGGDSFPREEAAMQLRAALRQLDPPEVKASDKLYPEDWRRV